MVEKNVTDRFARRQWRIRQISLSALVVLELLVLFVAMPLSEMGVLASPVYYLIMTMPTFTCCWSHSLPDAFNQSIVLTDSFGASRLLYFSFATLTTTGYGDIAPVHPLARSLANLEAVIGQLLPATLLARIGTLELAQRRH